jgi:hypothetical protein
MADDRARQSFLSEQTTGGLLAGHSDPWRWNRAIAWSGFCAGVLSGMFMGLWAFDGPLAPPAWIGGYGETARRLIRLGHIAFFGIGLLNLALTKELPDLALAERAKAGAAAAMNFANLILPFLLIAAALVAPLKYLLPFPVVAALAALALAAWGAAKGAGQTAPKWKRRIGE